VLQLQPQVVYSNREARKRANEGTPVMDFGLNLVQHGSKGPLKPDEMCVYIYIYIYRTLDLKHRSKGFLKTDKNRRERGHSRNGPWCVCIYIYIYIYRTLDLKHGSKGPLKTDEIVEVNLSIQAFKSQKRDFRDFSEIKVC